MTQSSVILSRASGGFLRRIFASRRIIRFKNIFSSWNIFSQCIFKLSKIVCFKQKRDLLLKRIYIFDILMSTKTKHQQKKKKEYGT